MNITIFIGGLNNGGAERVACNLANYLTGKCHTVEILTVSEVEQSYYLQPEVKVTNLLGIKDRKNLIYDNILRFWRYGKFLLTHKTDAYVVFLPATINLALSTKCLTKAVMIAAERANPVDYSAKTQNKLKKNARKADGWVFQTEEQKEWYNGLLGETKPIVVPNAINPDFIKPRYVGERKKLIVSSGRLNKQKNHTLLINAFAKIAEKYPDYNLCIYGEGAKRDELYELVDKLGLTERVSLPGYATNISERLQEASMFVLSSDFEGMPNALMEAMALGLPCVSTDCGGGGARFLIENGKNGLLVPQKDVDAMAAAMDRILFDHAFAEKLGVEARKICDTLAPEKIYGEWEKYIESVINDSKAK